MRKWPLRHARHGSTGRVPPITENLTPGKHRFTASLAALTLAIFLEATNTVRGLSNSGRETIKRHGRSERDPSTAQEAKVGEEILCRASVCWTRGWSGHTIGRHSSNEDRLYDASLPRQRYALFHCSIRSDFRIHVSEFTTGVLKEQCGVPFSCVLQPFAKMEMPEPHAVQTPPALEELLRCSACHA